MINDKEYLERKPNGMQDWQIEALVKDYRAFYANSVYTGKSAGGHGKAFNNEQRAKEWKKKILQFGGKVPTNREVNAWGRFNGEGSY